MFTLEDLTAITDAELRDQLDDALLAEHEPVDDMTTDVEYRENLPALIRILMDETHERALVEARKHLTALDRAEAVLAHVHKHGLHKHLSGINVGHRARVQLFEPQGESAIGALRPWIVSLGAETVDVVKHDDVYLLSAAGTIGQELPFSVVAITREAETAALDKVIEKYTQSLRKFPIRLLDACERPIPRDHIPSADCWCEPTFDQGGQFFKHPTKDGLPAVFEPPIVPGAEQDADGYAREDHR
ncbi:hypothetical protein [Amycolatopsis sp. BJA-103]|uniref:hypothetical protein n=1 Tax=Amycolatopsis sp. BJA-103 TaxID=1911175 RepID=UPI000C77243E|nr:hypothetical protein [Amycolatopsis sp. BJA-103]AUI56749.1 hypothetical protein BKN51_00010 [Amycolatopsis sp. BJA-103]AUI56810.1 hypothetical protein BKN51_00335 [Amycolatopsis sp. BJA-103]PNE13453.1 hypothetical protein B1H26_40205 [Amycolatopsis sp. BJA-103]